MKPGYLDKYVVGKDEYLTYNYMLYDEKHSSFWMYANRYSACFKVDLKTLKSDLVGWNKTVDEICRNRASVLGIYNDYLVCINRDYRYVELINTDTEEKRYVKLLFDTEPDMDEYVSRLNSKSDMLIMIQKKTGNVFAVSLDDIVNSEKVKVEGVLNGILHNGEEIINFFVVGKYSLLLMKDKKKLKVIDVDDYICEEYTLENSKREMSDIIVQGGKAYVLYRDGSIYVYDVITRKMIDCIYQAQDENDGKMYGRFCIVSGVIWVLPFSKDDIFSVDMEGKKKVIYENYPADFQYQFPENHPKFASITETKTHIYVGQRNANYMMVIDKSTGKEEWVQIKLPTEFHTKYLLDRFLENNDVIEESTVSLSAFVERVGQA